jgi:tetratricopeptide (TPR) repeat protein
MPRSLRIIVTAFVFCLLSSSLTLAQSKDQDPRQADKYPPSPLETVVPDPLLPPLTDKQQLSPQELQTLEEDLDQLSQAAEAKLQAGDRVAAFEMWNRELRLRRFLGATAEVQALGRVGAIATNQNDRQQVFYITQRLQTIQKQATSSSNTDLEFWRSLGVAYQKVRLPKLALQAYQQVLATVRQAQDASAEVETLNTIGELHLSWFDYPQAAATYQELLGLAAAKGDRMNQAAYLQQLAYIYEEGKDYQQSVNILNQIAEIYVSENNLTQIPKLKLAIAANYAALAKQQPDFITQAFKSYQEAYTSAWELEQYVNAGEALQKLIALYRSQGQIDAALQTSSILLEAETRASNFYGLMQAYDLIGQIYLERQQYPQAKTAFQQGLMLAQQIKHEEDYFQQQIAKASQPKS